MKLLLPIFSGIGPCSKLKKYSGTAFWNPQEFQCKPLEFSKTLPNCREVHQKIRKCHSKSSKALGPAINSTYILGLPSGTLRDFTANSCNFQKLSQTAGPVAKKVKVLQPLPQDIGPCYRLNTYSGTAF